MYQPDKAHATTDNGTKNRKNDLNWACFLNLNWSIGGRVYGHHLPSERCGKELHETTAANRIIGYFFSTCFLQVLDVGFNLIESLPSDAFASTSLLTLLALDGNPLATLPKQAFTHLNGTLRGLSLGGRFLECDCRLGWVAEWIRDTDLQVTSRERNPQFCATPVEFRTRSFYQLAPEGKFANAN